MARKNGGIMTKVGPWAFLLGLIIAIGTGLFIPTSQAMIWFLGVLGLIVGFLNISDEEVRTYLIASIAFMVSASSITTVFRGIPGFGADLAGMIGPIVTNIVVFIAPGAAIVALKALYMISKD